MFLGHFGVGLAAKKVAPKVSLGTLILAAQLADLVWPVFLILGWERVSIVPGATKVTPFDFTSFPYSHSLLAQIVWGIRLGAVYFAFRKDARGAMIAGVIVPSHWVLDYIVHRPDLPLIPGGTQYGLGIWNSLPLTLILEFAIFGAGIAVYINFTRPNYCKGRYALWSLLIFLLLSYLGSVFGPPPPSVHALALLGSAIWLTAPWAAWADGHRTIKSGR